MNNQIKFARPVLLFISGSAGMLQGDRDLLLLAHKAGWRPVLAPWFRIRASEQSTWLCNSIEMVSEGQIREIASWESIEPAMIWHRWRMTEVGRIHFQHLIRCNPNALVSYCPTAGELVEWATMLQSELDKQLAPTRIAKQLKTIWVHSLYLFQPEKVFVLARCAGQSLNDDPFQGTPLRPSKLVKIDYARRSAATLRDILRNEQKFTSKPDYSRQFLLVNFIVGSEKRQRSYLPQIESITDLTTSGFNPDGSTGALMRRFLTKCLDVCSPRPAINLPVVQTSEMPVPDYFSSIKKNSLVVDNLADLLGDWKRRACLLAQARQKLPSKSSLPIHSQFSPEGCKFRIVMQEHEPTIEVDLCKAAKLDELDHPLAKYFPLAHGDSGYVETAPWPGSEFTFLSPELRGPFICEMKADREQMLLRYLGRRIVKEASPDALGRRFVEPGSGRTCLVDFLHLREDTKFVDFSVTGIGMTQYSDHGFVDIGRKADGQAALARAEHRKYCGERLEEAGCRVAKVVAIISLPGLDVLMPDGGSSPSALIVRGFRCVLRVKQLDPLASFYHSVQHIPLVTSFLCNDRLFLLPKFDANGVSTNLQRQGEAHLLNLFYAKADDPRELYSTSSVAAESDASPISRRVAAIETYAPVLIEIAKVRLSGELSRDPETETISDDEYVCWFASKMGSQLALMRKLRFLHDHHHEGTSRYSPEVVYTLVETNVTLLAEFPDLDTGIFLDRMDSCALDRIQLSQTDFKILYSDFERFHERDVMAAASIVTTLAAVTSHNDSETIARAQADYWQSYQNSH